MTITHTQTSGTFNLGDVVGVSLPFGTMTSGNLVRVVVAAYSEDTVSDAVTDTQGNTYTKITSQQCGTSGNWISEFWTRLTATGANTISADRDAGGSGFQYITVAVSEYNSTTGWSASPVNIFSGSTSTGANPLTPNITTTAADCLVVASANDDTSDQVYTSPGAPWTNRWNDYGTVSHNSLVTEEQIVTSTGTYSCQWTRASSGDVGRLILAYQAPAGGGGGGGSFIYNSVKMTPGGITPMTLNLQGKNKFNFVNG